MESVDPKLLFASAQASVHFALECLEPSGNYLRLRSSFVNPEGMPMHWHEFGDLEGPGWGVNTVGGAHLLFRWGAFWNDKELQTSALKLLDHFLEFGFINKSSGLIYPYYDLGTGKFCLNYTHGDDWLCPGSLAKVGTQLLEFSDDLAGDARARTMKEAAQGLAKWLNVRVSNLPSGWLPRRITPNGEAFPFTPGGQSDAIFESSADGLYLLQLWAELGKRGVDHYTDRCLVAGEAFIEAGGYFGSINHDTYDRHENVSYATAFRVINQAGKILELPDWQDFAYNIAIPGLASFRMNEDRHGVPTTGLFTMEKSWNTAYLWENAEVALAYLEAWSDRQEPGYLESGLIVLQTIAAHHTPSGFLSEGVDWDNRVSRRHHLHGDLYGDICYTEPLLNNLHLLSPTLFYFQQINDQPPPKIDDQEAIRMVYEYRLQKWLPPEGSTGVRYLIRFYYPALETEERLAQALDFTRRSGADGVLLFEASYDMDPAILELEVLMDRFARLKMIIPRFREIVSEVQINVMITLGHVDAGSARPERLPFHFMVDETGNRSRSSACPLDPKYLKYISEVYRLAANCHPDAIWVDDDTRYLWHDIPGMTCFCDLHMGAMQARTGRLWTRDELVTALRDDSLDPSLRQVWFDLQEESILDLAKTISRVVHGVNPTIQIGLMSVGQSPHSAEGRRSDRLLRILAGRNRPLIRPGSGFYTDERPSGAFDKSQGCARELFFIGSDRRSVAEVENHPYTPFGKSERILALELVLNVLNGMPDLSLNLLTSMGGRGPLEPEGSDYAGFLVKWRPFLDSLAKERAGKIRLGIGLADHEDYGRVARLRGNNLTGWVQSRTWESLLARLGFPLGELNSAPHWFAGDAIRAISDYELAWCLREGSMLDPLAAQALIKRGWGNKLGLDQVIEVRTGVNEVLQDDPINASRVGIILPAYNHVPYKNLYTYQLSNPNARILSRWLDVDRQDQGPAMVLLSCLDPLFSADFSWKVGLLPYALTTPTITLLNLNHREILAKLLTEMNGGLLPIRVVKGFNIYPMVFQASENRRILVAVINLGADAQANCALEIPALAQGQWDIELLDQDGSWKDGLKSEGTRLQISTTAFTASILRMERT